MNTSIKRNPTHVADDGGRRPWVGSTAAAKAATSDRAFSMESCCAFNKCDAPAMWRQCLSEVWLSYLVISVNGSTRGWSNRCKVVKVPCTFRIVDGRRSGRQRTGIM